MSLPKVPKQRRRRCWFSASTVTAYVTVRSDVGYFLGHWKSGGTVRCSGKECSICESGANQRLFTYIFVEDERGEVLVFEIPERLYPLSQELESAVGTQLAIRREGTARNARIEVLITAYAPSESLDIWPFVNSLAGGIDSVAPSPSQSESVPAPSSKLQLP